MNKYEKLIKTWQDTTAKAAAIKSLVSPLQIGKKATKEEILNKEKEMGFELPPSYKEVLMSIGKNIAFYYSLSDITMPDEFKEIFSGGLEIDINLVESGTVTAEEELKNKVIFSHSGNGDLYLFDMDAPGEEKPVLYWEHEGGGTTLLANSFIEFLEAIAALYCVGDEIWQFQYFIDKNGLNPNTDKAKKWQSLFGDITTTTLNDVKDNLAKLINFTILHNSYTSVAATAFAKFDKEEILKRFSAILDTIDDRDKQAVIATLMGNSLGTYAKDWTMSKWEENKLNSETLAILALKTLPEEEALKLVTAFLEKKYIPKIDGISAWRHLRYFRSRKIIAWMESKVSFPIGGWDYLFFESVPDWQDIQKWAELGAQYEVALVQGLKYFVEKSLSQDIPKPLTLPTKNKFLKFLTALKEKQIMTTKAKIIESVIFNIEKFY